MVIGIPLSAHQCNTPHLSAIRIVRRSKTARQEWGRICTRTMQGCAKGFGAVGQQEKPSLPPYRNDRPRNRFLKRVGIRFV